MGKELSRQWGMAMCGPSPSRGAAGEPRDTKGGGGTTQPHSSPMHGGRGTCAARCHVAGGRGSGSAVTEEEEEKERRPPRHSTAIYVGGTDSAAPAPPPFSPGHPQGAHDASRPPRGFPEARNPPRPPPGGGHGDTPTPRHRPQGDARNPPSLRRNRRPQPTPPTAFKPPKRGPSPKSAPAPHGAEPPPPRLHRTTPPHSPTAPPRGSGQRPRAGAVPRPPPLTLHAW